MTVQLKRLRDEIDTDPLSRGYAAMTDAEVAADMNLQNRPKPISVADIFVYFQLNQKMGRIQLVADGVDIGAGVPDIDQRNSAHSIILALVSGLTDQVDLSDGETSTMFVGFANDLVAAGAITNGDKSAIAAMGANQRSRSQELGLWHHNLPEHAVTSARVL